ncbi:StfH/YfcO family fimbrial adhesin [Escherichia ruysiae]|uniref:StfH/YfcO family fimbrial adhesin n=1 Tax=Escherichia ruysiae TaxID=2608867 RepID=UPI00191AB96F
MKKIRLLFCAMLVLCFSQGVQAKLGAVYNNVPVYYGTLGATATLRFYLDLLTITGVYHGEYYQDRSYGVHYGDLPNKSWTGPGNIPAPKITVMSSGDGVVADSYCPGVKEIDPDFDWECLKILLTIEVNGSAETCPWMVGMTANSTVKVFINYQSKFEYYRGPTTYTTTCPGEPLTNYDISWSDSRVEHSKVLNLKSTGSVIEQNLSTYLMKDGQLCDGSKMDERGAYCRFVNQLITFTAEGCDDAKVTVAPTQHPITDRQLHDMLVRVDTSSRQPIDSTCRFQYVLNML